MNFLDKVNSRIEKNSEEMFRALSELIKIPSVASTEKAADHAPFGPEVDRAYRRMLEMAEKEGFETYDDEGFGGHVDYTGSGSEIVGIVGHLDVVPEGDGWDFDPYGGEIADGTIKGRGTVDDKGPVVASFYAMKALKECGFEPERTIRMILGLDEETNWEGMEHYLTSTDERPDMGFTPDGDFPVIRAEKGILIFDIVKKLTAYTDKGLELSSIKGGTAANAVAGFAKAVITDSAGGGYELIKEMVANCRERNGWQINCKGVGKSLEISVTGKSAHGAKPEMGINAITILMDFLGRLSFVNDGVTDFINFYNEKIGYNIHGENIGCGLTDEDSGKLIFNVGKIEADKNVVKLTINIRYPVSCHEDEVYEGLMAVLDEYDMGIVKGRGQDPINLDADSTLVKTLMDIYAKHTGDTESEPLVIGGGTYARAMDNIVAFGARFPDAPELEHQRNELISTDTMVKLAKIYAEAIYELAKGEN